MSFYKITQKHRCQVAELFIDKGVQGYLDAALDKTNKSMMPEKLVQTVYFPVGDNIYEVHLKCIRHVDGSVPFDTHTWAVLLSNGEEIDRADGHGKFFGEWHLADRRYPESWYDFIVSVMRE